MSDVATPPETSATVQPEPIRDLADIFKLGESGAHVAPIVGNERTAARLCKSASQVVASLRWAMDKSEQGALVRVGKTSTTLSADIADLLASVVPTIGPERATVAFVGRNPSDIDAARGEPLTGADGHTFNTEYLAPLGLTRDQVLVTNLLPMSGDVDPEVAARFCGYAKAELAAWRPRIVVALGKAAREELGTLANYALPHPSALRRHADTGELCRKLKKLRAHIDRLPACHDITKARIIKASEDAMSRVVVGVALDPYQLDSQDDWVPPVEIRDTAWGWMAGDRVIGFMHEGVAYGATAVESHLWPYPTQQDYVAAMQNQPHQAYESEFGTDMVHSGAWVVATQINDDALWGLITSGQIQAYSIGGYGVRTEIDPDTAMPQVTFIPQVAPT